MYINEDPMLQTLNLNNYTLRNSICSFIPKHGFALGSFWPRPSLKLLILTEEITQGNQEGVQKMLTADNGVGGRNHWGTRASSGGWGCGSASFHLGSHVEFSVCVHRCTHVTYKCKSIIYTKRICLENFLERVRLCGSIYSN